VARAIVGQQDIELVEVPYDPAGGHLTLEALAPFAAEPFAALVIPQPNFFGVLEPVDELTDWTQAQGMPWPSPSSIPSPWPC
jgi:glycine dehydrogenase subunit 1